MITSAIEAHEERDVAFIDIPGAFLHVLADEEIYMILCGTLYDIMVMFDPSLYLQYITYDSKGQALLYVKMNKA